MESVVLEENLVKNEEYKDFFIGAIASLAAAEKDAIRGFKFNDKGSDLLLESLEARNMSMYELSFRITLGSRETMDKFNETFVNATKTRYGGTSCELLHKVNMAIGESLFPSGGMDNATNATTIHLNQSSFVSWTRDFRKTKGTCLWPLKDYSMLLASEALEIFRVCMGPRLTDGHYILIMLSGLNALIIQKSEELAGPVLASVTLGTFTGDLVSEDFSSDDSSDDSTKYDLAPAIFWIVCVAVFLIILSTIVWTVRYVKRVARKDEAAKTMIKRQELQIRRMREAWMLEWDEITLLKQIGQGVAGEVWKGRMNETNWDVAVKIILGSEDIETGDDAEISFLRQCRHPRLVMFLGCGRCKSNDDIFLVLEMMECSVDTVLWREKANQATGNQVRYIRLLQDWSTRLRLISHIAAGMEYLHIEHEAIHRDLKTPNVLISFDKNKNRLVAKISDFGLARVFESQMDSRKEERKRQLSSSNDKVKRFISAEMTGYDGVRAWCSSVVFERGVRAFPPSLTHSTHSCHLHNYHIHSLIL